MTTQEMLRTDLKPGYWWANVAPLGEKPDWVMEVVPHESKGIFGYEVAYIMAKQQKKA